MKICSYWHKHSHFIHFLLKNVDQFLFEKYDVQNDLETFKIPECVRFDMLELTQNLFHLKLAKERIQNYKIEHQLDSDSFRLFEI